MTEGNVWLNKAIWFYKPKLIALNLNETGGMLANGGREVVVSA